MIKIENLTDEQRAAVYAPMGKVVLALAKPGSGKTTMLLLRIWYMVKELGIKQESIYLIAYSREMAADLRKKLIELNLFKVNVFTFHSLAKKIVDTDGYLFGIPKMRVLAKEEEVQDYIEEVLKEIKHLEEDSPLREYNQNDVMRLKKQYSKLVEDFVDCDALELVAHAKKCNVDDEEFLTLFYAFQKRDRVMDFTDMQILAVHMLQTDTEIRDKWRKVVQYLLIDEYQDIDDVQYNSVSLLQQGKNNLFVVGDSDQSIFAFRGAKVKYIQELFRDYNGAMLYVLRKNFRSTKNITDAATEVIKHNGSHIGITMETHKGYGDPLQFHYSENPYKESEWIAKEIKRLEASGVELNEIAVLARKKETLDIMMSTFDNTGIDYTVPKPISLLEENLIYQYLKAAMTADTDAICTTINNPYRKVSVPSLKQYMTRNKCSALEALKAKVTEAWMDTPDVRSYFDLLYAIRQWEKDNQYTLEEKLKNIANYLKYHPTTRQEKESWEELERVAYDFNIREYGSNSVAAFLKYVQNEKEMQTLISGRDKGVALMTMHASKGREFKVVFLPSLNQGVVPDIRAHSPGEFEEERRIFYVGMTRAAEKLYLSCTGKNVKDKVQKPSPFLAEIDFSKVVTDKESFIKYNEIAAMDPNPQYGYQYMYKPGEVVITTQGFGEILMINEEGTEVFVTQGCKVIIEKVQDLPK